LRQIAVTGLGRDEPTLFITNHPDASPRDMIMNYARRNRIEDGLGTNVNFFHLAACPVKCASTWIWTLH
jgi:hypothetical protein